MPTSSSATLPLTDARAILLLQAVEEHAESHGTSAGQTAGADYRSAADPVPAAGALPWGAADAAWASAEARRRLGGSATPAAFVAERARLGLQRLASRQPGWATWPLAESSAWRPLVQLGLPLALLAGWASDWLAASGQRIQLLAPPVLALLLWNLLVYAALALALLRRPVLGQRADAPAAAVPQPVRQGLRRALVGLAGRWAARSARAAAGAAAAVPAADAAAGSATVAARFAALLWSATAPLQQWRAAAWLHTGAALFAVGVLLSMYAHGLVLDYRAGWDSTFLDATQVHRLLQAWLGPAAAINGQPLPSVAELARLRWADGGPGDAAARWIHWHALTVAALVLLPRALLAGWALLRSRRAAAKVALPWQAAYFRALVAQGPVHHRQVTVLPYSLNLSAEQQAALGPALEGALGPGARPLLADNLPLGAEDQLPRGLPPPWQDGRAAAAGEALAVLLALSATPERETHGAFVRAVQRQLPAGAPLHVLVDASGYRQRLGRVAEAASRLEQRRQAWQRMLADAGAPAPAFVDLSSASDATAAPHA